MIDSNSLQIAVRSGPNSYMVSYQLPEPGMEAWHSSKPGATIVLEASKLGEDDWSQLGKVSVGVPFEVPSNLGPVPVFRTEHGNKYRYIGVRKIDLEGTSNFRDIGGYTAGNSSQIRFGKIFRSDNLAKLTPHDWSLIRDLGVNRIIDLRRSDEKERQKTRIPKNMGIEITEIPIDVEILGKSELIEHIFSREVLRITNEDMAQMYEDLLGKARSELTQAVSLLIEPAASSTIVHCTAGKDRTGLSVTLVQLLCAVPKEQIMSDFLLSNSFRTPARIAAISAKLKAHKIDLDDIVPYLSASKQALLRAFEILGNQFSGASGYLDFDEMPYSTPIDEWQSGLIYR